MSPILSADDLHRIFKNLDKDNNGLVSIQELHLLLDRIGIRTTLEELEKIVGNTTLDYIDFFFFYEAMVKARIQERNVNGGTNVVPVTADIEHNDDLLKAFRVFDLNGDGSITSEELQCVLSRLGLWDEHSGQDCKDMIRVYDKNSDGSLDFEEFKEMMTANPSNPGS